MTPRKAIIIIFILFLIIASGFIFLYINRQAAIREKLLNSSPSPQASSPVPKSNLNPVEQAELKELDRLRGQSSSKANNQSPNQAEDLQSLDKLRQNISTTTPSVKDAQAEIQDLDKLRAQDQTAP